MDKKKIFYLIIFIVLVIAFAIMIYFVFIADLIAPPVNNSNTNENTNTLNTNGLPVINGNVSNVNRVNVNQTNSGGFINSNTGAGQNLSNIADGGQTIANEVYNNPLLSPTPTIVGDGFRFYDSIRGKFYYIDENGNYIELSDQVFPDAEDVRWSPVNNKAVITFPDESKIMYDFDAHQQVTLPKEWDDITFSSNGNQLGFLNLSSNENERWLAVSSPDGSKIQLIEPIGDKANSVDVNWSPSNQVVATYREGYNASGQEAFLIGLNDENFKSILTDGRGFEGKWSPNGEQMLYSVFNSGSRYNPTLYLVDAEGDNIGTNVIKLGLQTWTSKCAFSSKSPTLYCAVPGVLPTGAGLDPSVAVDTNDTIYKINTNTGAKELLALPVFLADVGDYNIGSMFLNNSENALFFTDALSNNLYTINL